MKIFFLITLRMLNVSIADLFIKKWFTAPVLKKVYNKYVADHPKGWDALAERFNKKSLQNR